MPRIQQRLIVIKATGGTEISYEVLPDADLDRRLRDLKATIPPGMDTAGPEATRRLTLACDGCGAIAELDYDNPRKPEGWTEQDSGDYCPACTF
jgi:hypothetical protein